MKKVLRRFASAALTASPEGLNQLSCYHWRLSGLCSMTCGTLLPISVICTGPSEPVYSHIATLAGWPGFADLVFRLTAANAPPCYLEAMEFRLTT